MDTETDTTREARLLRCVSLGGAVTLGLTLGFMAGLAVTGSMLAVRVRQIYPASREAADAAAQSFSLLAGWHFALSTLLVLSALVLLAMSILFSMHVVFFDAKKTRRQWAQTVMASILTVCVLAAVVMGNAYSAGMMAANHWLLAPPGGYAPDVSVAKSATGGAGAFSTFVAFHAIIVPMLAVMVIALMLPPFCEFARRREDQKKVSKLKLRRDPTL